ncbi:hypothetical protein ACF1DV_25900 [Streptomyces achromogenes]|uniref:hypothetical protein n=1 Tax=Streptomyces achromogenes TaxID=67255 RepID=UPI0036F564E3
MPEPQLHDTVIDGDRWYRIVDFSEDHGTKLSDGRWVCASKFIPVTRACWRYEPKPAPIDEEAELFEELWSMEYRITGDKSKAQALARDFLARHAHALAEKIRSAPMAVGFEDGMWEAADLIDPEVSS